MIEVGTGVTDPLVVVRDLHVRFAFRRRTSVWTARHVNAVNGVDLDIERRATLGLVGESGCGKTTLGRSLLRLVRTEKGSVWFDRINVLRASGKARRALRRRMQIVFQDPIGSLNPRMTVRESIAEPLVIQGSARDPRPHESVSQLLDQVGLARSDAARYPHELSGGQLQRVGIARALILNPSFLVLDEPVSALDVSIQAQIINLLCDLKQHRGMTYLFIAHNLSVVRQVSDRIAAMYLGKIVEQAEAGRLFGRPMHPYTLALLSAIPQTDPNAPSSRIMLHGEVPNPFSPPSGCAFHPRCPFASDLCGHVAPELEAKPGCAPDHLVACHHPQGAVTAG